MAKKKKQVNPYARKICVAFKVNADEMRKLLAQAQRHTGGNVSMLAREAAIGFKGAGKRK